MSAFKGTPGPWEAHRAIYPTGWNIEARDGTTYTVAIARDGSGSPQNEANARLISAAPELLEALRPLADLDLRPDGFDQLDDDQPIYARDSSVITVGDVRRAIAAIAKATGGAA